MERFKTTITPYKTNLGRLPTIKRSLGRFPTNVSIKPATQDRPIPVRTSGPRYLPFGSEPLLEGVGPGEPPPGWSGAFPGGASRDEWLYLYWPLWKVLRCKGDPRNPPYEGCSVAGKSFRYQAAFGGGRLRKGGQVIDAEVIYNETRIAVRLLTERYHAAARREQQVRDMRGKIELSKFQKVCDIWTQAVAGDDTGEAACRAIAECLRGKSTPDPFTFGFRRVRTKVRKREA